MVGHGFLFSLPLSFFEDATCVGSSSCSPADEDRVPTAALIAESAAAEHGPTAEQKATGWSESGATCIACGIGVNSQGFTSSTEQRQHFRTDWHRYNLKRRLEKKPPLTEDEFDCMIEADDDVSSISGSEGDSSDTDNEDDGAGDGGGQLAARRSAAAAASIQGAQAVFRTADGGGFAVWRCLLLPDSHKHKEEPTPQQLLQLLRQLRQSPESHSATTSSSIVPPAEADAQQLDTAGCIWIALMLRGGHFAGAVVRINSTSSSSQAKVSGGSSSQATAFKAAAAGQDVIGSGSQQQQQRGKVQQAGPAAEPFTVLAHKTFHRYVVRAKAGGKQSTKDATGKYARSAGSRLRRYNETALQRDITQLLREWAPHIQAAQLIFLAASGSNSRVLFTAAADVGPLGAVRPSTAAIHSSQRDTSQSPAVLDSSDQRVRRVPFATQRPTFSEVKRVVMVLGSIRQVDLPSEADLAAAAAAAEADGQQQQQQEQKQVEVLQPSVSAAAVSPSGVAKKQEEPALIKASRSGDAERVARLLANGHDPTVRDSKGRSPYQLAASKEVRDAFRRFMAAAPGAWDYSASGIPSPLTQELEEAQQSKKAEKRARQKAKEKERKDSKPAAAGSSSSGGAAARAADSFDDELAAAMAEAAAISSRAAASGRSKQVGPAGASSSSKGKGRPASGPATAAAPSPEEVARRREQLAAAAEARLKALQQKQQLW